MSNRIRTYEKITYLILRKPISIKREWYKSDNKLYFQDLLPHALPDKKHAKSPSTCTVDNGKLDCVFLCHSVYKNFSLPDIWNFLPDFEWRWNPYLQTAPWGFMRRVWMNQIVVLHHVRPIQIINGWPLSDLTWYTRIWQLGCTLTWSWHYIIPNIKLASINNKITVKHYLLSEELRMPPLQQYSGLILRWTFKATRTIIYIWWIPTYTYSRPPDTIPYELKCPLYLCHKTSYLLSHGENPCCELHKQASLKRNLNMVAKYS